LHHSIHYVATFSSTPSELNNRLQAGGLWAALPRGADGAAEAAERKNDLMHSFPLNAFKGGGFSFSAPKMTPNSIQLTAIVILVGPK
jgi:hypothetical protein